MKKGIICLLLVSMFILGNTALAANWAYVNSFNWGFSVVRDYFLDTESVCLEKNGFQIQLADGVKTFDCIIFWSKEIDNDGSKFLNKYQATTEEPYWVRLIDAYHIDAANNLKRLSTAIEQNVYRAGGNNPVKPMLLPIIKKALINTREGKDTGNIPSP